MFVFQLWTWRRDRAYYNEFRNCAARAREKRGERTQLLHDDRNGRRRAERTGLLGFRIHGQAMSDKCSITRNLVNISLSVIFDILNIYAQMLHLALISSAWDEPSPIQWPLLVAEICSSAKEFVVRCFIPFMPWIGGRYNLPFLSLAILLLLDFKIS